MADRFDLAWNTIDETSVTAISLSATTSGSVTLNPEGSDFTLAAAASFRVGDLVLLISADFSTLAVCVVVSAPDSTHVRLKPIQSSVDNATLPIAFASGSILSTFPMPSAQMVLDLSEAPEPAYDYLILANACVETDGTPGAVTANVRAGALLGDPTSGDTVSRAQLTLTANNPDRVNWVSAFRASLTGGQRYEYILEAASNTSGQVATVTNPRILALRVTGGYFAGAGDNAETTTSSSSLTYPLDLGANLPAGTYLIAAAWAASNSSTSNRAEVVLEQDGSTVLAQHIVKPNVSTDYPTAGFAAIVTLGATNRVRLGFRAYDGGTAKLKNHFLCAVPVANIPAIADVHASLDLATTFSQSVSDNTYRTAKTSDAVTLEAGRHIEIISASVGGSAAFRSRPNFGSGADDGPGMMIGRYNGPGWGNASTDFTPTFWLARSTRVAGSTTSHVEMRRNTAATTTLQAKKFAFSWLREVPDFRARPDDPVAVVADVELGGRVLRNWNSTTTSGRFYKHLPDVEAVSRVIVNGVEFTRVSSVSALADGRWYWNAATRELYVQIAPGDTPADDDQVVVVVPALLVGRVKEDLLDSDGTSLPYRPLLRRVPGAKQQLRSRSAKFATGAQFGEVSIAAAHGAYDDALRRASLDSYRVRVRRAYRRAITKLSQMEVAVDALIVSPSINLESGDLSLRLVDRRLVIQQPVASTKITVREAFGTEAREREDQELPVCWGPLKGLVAWRITANEGGADWNEYQFCDHGVKSIDRVWLDAERTIPLATDSTLDTSSTYSDQGKLRINNSNSALPSATEPPDKVYVDIVGRTSNGTTTGRAYQTPGEIARDLLVSFGGVTSERLIERTFREIDRLWRYQLVEGVGDRPLAPRLGFIVEGKTTVEQALSLLCENTVSYWISNRQGRIGLGVPDFDAGNLVENGEFDSALTFPWVARNGAGLSTTTTRKFRGTRSAEVTNGGSPAGSECIAQALVHDGGGRIVVTLVASLVTGDPMSFRIGILESRVESLSEPFTLETGRWKRCTFVYEPRSGDSGRVELRIYPAQGSTTATTVAVDAVEAYRVAAVLDATNSKPLGLTTEDEHYYEATCTHSVNLAGDQSQGVSRRRVTESEAKGLSSAIEPEGKFAVPSSTRAELLTLAADGSSAGGFAAPIPLYYSRPRQVLSIEAYGLERIPLVGDYVCHLRNPRVPETIDEYPIWRAIEVGYNESHAKVVKLKVTAQMDPVQDRSDIAPDSFPMGAIAITRSSGSVTDFSDVSALENQFVLAHTKPDTSTQRGGYYHRHPLTHQHPLASHDHDVTPDSASGPIRSLIGYPDSFEGFPYPGPAGPQLGVAVSDATHTHGVPTTPLKVAAASGTSGPPTTSLQTSPGPVEPSYRRVRFLQRTNATLTTIPQDLIVGIRSTVIPAGWKRVEELDGYFIRGATSRGAVSTTLAAGFTPNDSGSTLVVASATNISVGKRLRVRNTADSNKQVHVVVTAIAGTSLTVVPLHETTDEPNTYSFPAGATSTVVGDSEAVDTTFTAPTHKHGGVVPTHQHPIGCPGHAKGAAEIITGFDSVVTALVTLQLWLGGGFNPFLGGAAREHAHSAEFPLEPDNTPSGSAGGTLSGDVEPLPPYYELVFIQPVDANQTVLPAGAILFWTMSNTPPAGYEVVGEARGLLVRGCPAGSTPGSSSGGHAHEQTSAAHTAEHDHGGEVTATAKWPGPNFSDPLANYGIGTKVAAAAGDEIEELWHSHDIDADVSKVDPGLAQVVQDTAAPDTLLPLCKRVMLIRKT